MQNRIESVAAMMGVGTWLACLTATVPADSAPVPADGHDVRRVPDQPAATAAETRIQPRTPELHGLTAIPIQQVTVADAFWSPKLKVWRQVTLPDCFTKFEKDGALANFDAVRDGKKVTHKGPRGTTG